MTILGNGSLAKINQDFKLKIEIAKDLNTDYVNWVSNKEDYFIVDYCSGIKTPQSEINFYFYNHIFTDSFQFLMFQDLDCTSLCRL